MKTITTTVYDFDELSPEAQARAIEHERDFEWEYGMEWLEDFMTEELHRLLEDEGARVENYDDVKVRYSLGYSQGDGASFVGEFDWKVWHVTVGENHWGTRYQHYNSVEIKEIRSRRSDRPAPDSTIEKLEGIIEHIGRQLEYHGYKLIEDNTSDELIRDRLRDMKGEFYYTEEGDRA